MGFATEFKEFALKGNVIDLAVGVIIGAAFGKIVDSIVSDLIMPVVGRVFGGLDFSNYFIPLAGQTATNLADATQGRRGVRLRQLHHRGAELRDPGLHHLHDGAADQQAQVGRAAAGRAAPRPRTCCCCARFVTH